MKLPKNGSNVIASHGVHSEAAFKIKTSAQAFRILSSGLYSDKTAAVLREVGCNAADSHIAAGHPNRPIEVKLPNSLDREFYIKDWGVGLAHEEVTGLFSTYFSSNKSDSNEQTGAFGLGSKSPFSYTDSFSITAVKAGVQRSYAAHLGADGSPVISLLDETKATEDWPSGVMVTFPVNPADVGEFRAKAQTVFQRFRVFPNIIGADPIVPMVQGLQGENFWFPASQQKLEAVVIMGNVAYPLVLAALENEDKTVAALIKSGIQLRMNMGSVMPTASREALEYDSRTRRNVLAALKAAGRAIAQQLLAKAQEPCESEWLRRRVMRQFRGTLPAPLTERIPELIRLLKMPGPEEHRLETLFAGEAYQLPVWVGDNFELAPERSCKVYLVEKIERRTGSKVMRKLIRGGVQVRGRTAEKAIISFDSDVQVVYDNSTHAYARARRYVEDGKTNVVLMVEAASKQADRLVLPYAQRLAREVGDIPCRPSGELPVPQLVKAVRGKPATRAAALKAAYVEETVQYLSLSGPTIELEKAVPLTLAQVPAEARYYITGFTFKARYSSKPDTKFYADLPNGGGRRTLASRNLFAVLQRYRHLCKAGLPLPSIEGFAILESGQAGKLKLREHGWKELMETVGEALLADQTVEELRRRLNRMPFMDQHGWTSHETARFLTGLRRCRGMTEPTFWNAFEPHLGEFPALAKLLTAFLAANDGRNMQEGLKGVVYKLLEDFPVPLKGKLPKDQEIEDVGDQLLRSYPLLKYLNAEVFFRAAAEDPANAVKCLKQMLISKETLSAESAAQIAQAA